MRQDTGYLGNRKSFWKISTDCKDEYYIIVQKVYLHSALKYLLCKNFGGDSDFIYFGGYWSRSGNPPFLKVTACLWPPPNAIFYPNPSGALSTDTET